MTTITIHREHRARTQPHLLKRAISATQRAAKAVALVALTPHKAALRRLTEMPLTVAAAGLFDWAGFHLGSGWGLAITGVSLVIVEHLISDDTGRDR